jgi:exonuclease III
MKSQFLSMILFAASIVFQASAYSGYIPPKLRSAVEQNQTIRVMSYNVENLFDAKHDQGKNDFEFLPKENPEKIKYCNSQQNPQQREKCLKDDWTEARYLLKLSQINTVFALIPNPKPQIVGLVEVENEGVVKQLAKTLGYRGSVTTNSPDARGIDVALMYNESRNLKFMGATPIRMDVSQVGKPTRDILEVAFQVQTSTKIENLLVYVNHWPSQGAPAQARIAVARKLASIVKMKLASGYHVIVLGDFNVIPEDQPNPFNDLARTGLYDTDALFRKWAATNQANIGQLPLGTYFYGNPGGPKYPAAMSWNLLDRFIVSKSLLENSSLQLDLSSYRIFSHPALTSKYEYKYGTYAGTVVTGVPRRYYHYTDDPMNAGYSDHFSILVDLVFH